MMTLAQFLATHRLPNAIVIPGRGRRIDVQPGRGKGLGAHTQSIKPTGGSQAARLPRGFLAQVGHGKKK